MKPSEYLFPSRTGGKTNSISRVMAYNILNEAGHVAGLGELGTHTLRKTFGYHFYKKYKDAIPPVATGESRFAPAHQNGYKDML